MKLLVDPTVKIVHAPRWSSKTDLRYLWRHLQSAFRFFRSPVYREARLLKAGVSKDPDVRR
jgi:UDP-N-acetyl-D-mannosaminuronic acid transferase (WecB/TagA/CpsF family)